MHRAARLAADAGVEITVKGSTSLWKRRIVTGVVATFGFTGALVAIGSPAYAGVSCSAWRSADMHTGYAYCWYTGGQQGTGTFRVKARFCTLQGCQWEYGPYKFISGGVNSTKTNSGAWIANDGDVMAEMGPPA